MAKPIVIYTDGSGNNKTKIGGWGATINIKGVVIETSGCARDTTTNRMEMMAAIRALRLIITPSRIKLFTDSEYLQKGASQFIRKWSMNDWQPAKDRNLKNLDLWMRLYDLIDRHDITWIWVPGHKGIDGNERADELAGNAFRLLRDKVAGEQQHTKKFQRRYEHQEND